EKLFAPGLLKAIAAILDQLPIAYTVRIETTGADIFQHAHAGAIDDATKAEPIKTTGGNVNGNGSRSLHHYNNEFRRSSMS
ncbi:MAG: hypothetical protein ABI885_01950, partial [Gammaproteobacteria bacterium]